MGARAKEWATFLRIPAVETADHPPLDPGWCTAMGINPGAPVILRLLRDNVLPLVRRATKKLRLARYHYLVHDRSSGVPTDVKDRSAFIHLRFWFSKPVDLHAFMKSFPVFEMTYPIEILDPTAIGGIDPKIVCGKDFSKIEALLDAQSAWVLAFVEAHKWEHDEDIVRQLRQVLHWLANMTQMRVQ